MQHWQQYSLPLQRPRVPSESRPHTVHTSTSSPFLAEQDAFEQDEQTPRGSLAGLGILSEVAERRPPCDDTAADVNASCFAGPSKSELPFACEDAEGNALQQEFPYASFRARRQSRKSVFRAHSNSQGSSSTEASDANMGPKAVPSIGRRLSKSYGKIASDIRDNVQKYAPGGRSRRPSSSQAVDGAAPRGGSGNSVPVAPTSPSKRNGKHEGDRPMKMGRQLLNNKQDRKDTPAPSLGLTARPASSHPNATTYVSVYGGDRARQAAAASKASPLFNDDGWDGQADLIARRSRVGSMSSAADSGADLSCPSNSVDADGDIEMAVDTPQPPPLKFDPLKKLPSEIALQVFEYLDAHDLVTAERVHSSWRAMALKTSVWRNAFNRRYARQIYTDPAPVQIGGVGCGRPNRPNQEWKKMYKARMDLEQNWRKGALGAGKAIYLAGHTDSVYCLQFDEEKIITGSRDRTIRVWDINNFTCQKVIGGPSVRPGAGPKVLRTVDYPDFHLATASVNGTAYGDSIFETPAEYHDASILCLQYDEQILVTGSSDSDLLVWDVKTYKPMKRLRRHTGGVLDVALDAKHIVSCSKDSRIIVWDRATYEPRGELTGHRGPVNAVQLRGKYLVSASGDGIARLWDLDQMKLIKEFSAKERGLAAVEFSEDMQYVLAGGNDTITYKFETETGKEVKQFVGHSQLVRSLWLDSQNNRVVSGSYDLDLRVYDFVTGEEIWRAEEWTTSWMLAAKSDYRRIVATSQDGRILIIDFGLLKCATPDDGQPIENIDLLRGSDRTTAIQWRNPWELARQQEAERAADRALQRGIDLATERAAALSAEQRLRDQLAHAQQQWLNQPLS